MLLKSILSKGIILLTIFSFLSCSTNPVEDVINETLMPTVGVGDITFQDSGNKVVETYGTYDEITAIVSPDGAQFVIWYEDEGLGFQMEHVDVGSRSLQEIVDESELLIDLNKSLTTMVFMSKFKGTTMEGIGIGTSRDQVIEAYGEPDDIGSLAEDYDDLKMSVWYNSTNESVRRIDLFR